MGGVGKSLGQGLGHVGKFAGGAAGGLLGGVSSGLAGGMGKGGNTDALIGLLNDETGKPKYPGFTSMIDPSTGFLDPKYQLKNTLDTAALDKLQEQALSEGPSKWAQLAEATQKSQAASQSKGAIEDAASRLAMRGGLSSGAAERLGQAGAGQTLAAQQDIGGKIAIQDELNKQAALAALPGLQQSKSQFGLGIDQYNIGNVLSQKQQEEMAKLAEYQEQMKGYAAKKAGLATLAGGGKKG